MPGATRAGKRAFEEEDRLMDASRESGASVHPIGSAEREFQEIATGLDEGLFHVEGKARKGQKERKIAKRMFTLFGDQNSCDAQANEPCTEAGSQVEVSSSEAVRAPTDVSGGEIVSDHEGTAVGVGEVSDSPTVMSTSELKRLQREDPTLSRIREQVETKKGDCFWQDGLLYRRWHPVRSDKVDDMGVDQLVLPVQCRACVLKLAHDIPASGWDERRR